MFSAPRKPRRCMSSNTFVACACAAVPNGLAVRELNVGGLAAPVSNPAWLRMNVSRSSAEFAVCTGADDISGGPRGRSRLASREVPPLASGRLDELAEASSMLLTRGPCSDDDCSGGSMQLAFVGSHCVPVASVYRKGLLRT